MAAVILSMEPAGARISTSRLNLFFLSFVIGCADFNSIKRSGLLTKSDTFPGKETVNGNYSAVSYNLGMDRDPLPPRFLSVPDFVVSEALFSFSAFFCSS